MDVKDRKILALLDENARMPTAVIAKKVKLSRQVVDYRIQQLVEKGVIRTFVTFVDFMKFQNNMWHVYIKLHNLTPDAEKKIQEFLLPRDDVWWIVNCQGEWDLIFSATGDNLVNFDALVTEFKSTFHTLISDLLITTLITGMNFPRGYFLKTETIARKAMFASGKTPIHEKDIAILKIIITNARMPATQIAEKTGLTARQVIYRIKEMEKKGIINGYRLHMNFNVLGHDYYKICFYTQDFTEKSEKSIISWCEVNPYTIFYVRKIAPWTFEIEFETKDYKQLNSILKEMRTKFGNIIRRTETTLITEEFKGELDILKTR
jgi:DNA-binding Lrp family transcriptional regulator